MKNINKNKCFCGCGQEIKEGKKFVSGHNAKLNLEKGRKEKIPIETRNCICGCNQVFECKINSKQNFIIGHNLRILTLEQRKLRGEKTSKSLKEFNKLNPLARIETAKKISKTKLSIEGNKKVRDALLKCKGYLNGFKKGNRPSNYISEENKPKIPCLNCGKICIVTPTVAKTKKYCSNECRKEYITGKPMLNWNPNSFHNKSGRGVSGEYKNIRFRSTLELAFLIWALNNQLTVIAEPVAIKIKDYLPERYIESYKDLFNNKSRYTPDFLINGRQIIEIKPEYNVYNGTDNYNHETRKVIMKIITVENYCNQNNLEFGLVTNETLKDCLLTDKKIRQIPKEDIKFFRQRHKKKYKNEG